MIKSPFVNVVPLCDQVDPVVNCGAVFPSMFIEARTAGCRTISGLEMFLYQAVAQFERWTGQSAPIQVMRAVLESRFP